GGTARVSANRRRRRAHHGPSSHRQRSRSAPGPRCGCVGSRGGVVLSSLITLASVAQIVLGIGFLIFVHELGHYLVARYFGVRVELFSIGFGPAIFSWRRGDTEYRVAWIPIGGYVLMAGEESSTGARDELGAKSVPARLAVYSAGVAMNLVFAV